MNKLMIIGNLTKAPEARTTKNGTAVTTLNVAVKRPFNKEGKSDFFRVITWRGLAENCDTYLVKGQKVAVSGFVQIDSYEDKDGKKIYTTEVVADDVEFLQKPKSAESEETPPKNEEFTPLDDEELPF